ncbi:MAG: hypothetical protein OK474_09470 [Thaumarchaeota archaeon]|nr:hypothetical protein [Nitrososphaerota archaeon]
MEEEDPVQGEAPKTRTGVSETSSSPKVSQEPDFPEVRSGSGSQSVHSEATAEAEQEPQESMEHSTRTTLSDSESQSERGIIQQTSATVSETSDGPVLGEDSSRQFGSFPMVLSARAYGCTYVKKNGQIGGSVDFRLRWQQVRTANGVRFEEQKLYRVSGMVEDVFDFQAHFFASGYRQIIIHVPVRCLDRIRPLEVHKLTISSVEEIETMKPVGEIVDGIHVSSWRRFANSKLVDSEKGEDFGDGPPRRLNEIERMWLAGVIDGEGSIFIIKLTRGLAAKGRRGFSYIPAISLSSTSEAFARKVREIIGRGAVNFTEEKRPNWKDKWSYRCGGLVVRGLLPQLLPHLLIKREVAEKMLQYLAFVDATPIDGRMEIPPGYYERLDSLYITVKESNEKGKDVPAEVLAAMLTLPKSLKNRGRGSRAVDCRVMTEGESAWLAGVVDGEGSIFLSKVTHPAYRRGFFYRPQIEVSNSNRSFLVRVMEIIGEGTVQPARKGGESLRTRWEYSAASGVLRAILPQILPYMVIKGETAGKILEYFQYIDEHPIRSKKEISKEYYEKLDSLYSAIKKMNEKGKPSKS